MTYKQALKVKIGDILLIPAKNYIDTSVLEIEKDLESKTIFFRCTDGVYVHTALSPFLSPSNLVEIFIKNPKTRVFINYNNEIGDWRYSVVVADSGGFWLDSFESRKEAEKYIHDHHLIQID